MDKFLSIFVVTITFIAINKCHGNTTLTPTVPRVEYILNRSYLNDFYDSQSGIQGIKDKSRYSLADRFRAVINRKKRSIINKIKKLLFNKNNLVRRQYGEGHMEASTRPPMSKYIPTMRPTYVNEAVWVKSVDFTIPKGAFVAGMRFEKNMYVGRGAVGPNIYAGYLRDGDGCVFVAWDKRWAGCLSRYEVLVGTKDQFKWVPTTGLQFLHDYDAVVGGWQFIDKKANYICRQFDSIYYDRMRVIFGSINLYDGLCWLHVEGEAKRIYDFDVLVYARERNYR